MELGLENQSIDEQGFGGGEEDEEDEQNRHNQKIEALRKASLDVSFQIDTFTDTNAYCIHHYFTRP